MGGKGRVGEGENVGVGVGGREGGRKSAPFAPIVCILWEMVSLEVHWFL